MTQETTLNTVDAGELRQAFGAFASGATVVTALGADGYPYGAMVTAFAAVSVDPPLAQITLPRGSRAAKYLKGESFTINVLSVDQIRLAQHFAALPLDSGPQRELMGVDAVLSGNAATLQCQPWNAYDGGDHIIVVGEVVGLDVTAADPLLSFGDDFHQLGSLIESGIKAPLRS